MFGAILTKRAFSLSNTHIAKRTSPLTVWRKEMLDNIERFKNSELRRHKLLQQGLEVDSRINPPPVNKKSIPTLLKEIPSLHLENQSSSLKEIPFKKEYKRIGGLAFKMGMMTMYDDWGKKIPATILHFDDCEVTRVYPNHNSIVQEVGIGKKSVKQLNNARKCFYEGMGIHPKLHTQGFNVQDVSKFSMDSILPPGTPILASHFVAGQSVDIQALSKDKGFQGAMKRWGFKGMPASHGCSKSHRSIGAMGGSTNPGRVIKGKKMAGHMGDKNCTILCLKILRIDNLLNCIIVQGSVPGRKGGVVRIWDSSHNPIFKTNPPPFPTIITSANSKSLPRYLDSPEVTKNSIKLAL